ncbi:PREDICTED: orexin receptor type 2-like [Ceratosolen solmsi marchali]|uniref:Orexin receptor type 2-like n=1 Tax=Ceratosolen solmsi marchali TaxID=326594 RepID=A0AAJ6YNB7_9HYME|nr:PREDICTED: orexin receptor type 2-like [Ceratosolen solmsi marchali]
MELLFVAMLAFFPIVSANSETDSNDDNSQLEDPESNCTTIDCIHTDVYIGWMYDHIYPKSYEWILIAMHCVVFVIGLVGNALVCLAVYRNHTMRTVTNYFIVNLAVADLLVIIVCLPPTIVWDITETWFLGLLPCKIILYLQVIKMTKVTYSHANDV